jgi:hypothetical protein
MGASPSEARPWRSAGPASGGAIVISTPRYLSRLVAALYSQLTITLLQLHTLLKHSTATMEQTKALNALEPFLALSKSATSPRAASDLISQATSAPNTYVFAELLQTPNIQNLRTSEEYASYLTLLEIFAWGTWEDYKCTSGISQDMSKSVARRADLEQHSRTYPSSRHSNIRSSYSSHCYHYRALMLVSHTNTFLPHSISPPRAPSRSSSPQPSTLDSSQPHLTLHTRSSPLRQSLRYVTSRPARCPHYSQRCKHGHNAATLPLQISKRRSKRSRRRLSTERRCVERRSERSRQPCRPATRRQLESGGSRAAMMPWILMTTVAVVEIHAVVRGGLPTLVLAWADGWDSLSIRMHRK